LRISLHIPEMDQEEIVSDRGVCERKVYHRIHPTILKIIYNETQNALPDMTPQGKYPRKKTGVFLLVYTANAVYFQQLLSKNETFLNNQKNFVYHSTI
jgi:hypothetical protein